MKRGAWHCTADAHGREYPGLLPEKKGNEAGFPERDSIAHCCERWRGKGRGQVARIVLDGRVASWAALSSCSQSCMKAIITRSTRPAFAVSLNTPLNFSEVMSDDETREDMPAQHLLRRTHGVGMTTDPWVHRWSSHRLCASTSRSVLHLHIIEWTISLLLELHPVTFRPAVYTQPGSCNLVFLDLRGDIIVCSYLVVDCLLKRCIRKILIMMSRAWNMV